MVHAASTVDAVVLVVEDDPATRSVETIVLEEDGFTVVQANTGEDGLRLAQEHRPGVILLDLALPRMSGFDLLNRLKSTSSTAHAERLIARGRACPFRRVERNCPALS